MPTVKPTKPSITLPTAFGTSPSNVKTQFTAQELIDGYSASIPQVLDGGNLNYMIDAMFQYLTWSNKYADWYASGTANTVPYINSSNQLDYASPVFGGSNNNFTGTNTFVTQSNTDDSQKVATTEYVHNILEAIYPVGSVYIGTQNSCPMSVLISGSTWALVAENKALWGGNGSNGNTTISAGLPNITGSQTVVYNSQHDSNSGCLDITGSDIETSQYGGTSSSSTRYHTKTLSFDASKSNSIYGNSTTVQPPAYRVNVWRRTA